MATAAAGQRRAPSILRVFSQPKMAAILFLGFSSGLPLYLTSQNLQAWMTLEGVDLATIGMFSLVTLPYSLKFLWAPLMDRYVPPFLGRRRGWLVVTQVGLMLAIAAMSLQDPTRALQLVAFNAILIAFFSASQDVVFDAYRVDVLDEREMGAGAALGVLGYRIAMIVVGGLGFILADQMPWPMVYLVMASLMLVGIIAAVRAPNPTDETPPGSLADAVIHPFVEFFSRTGIVWGIVILLFVIAYQLPDRFGQNMATPFLLEVGYTQTEIGAIRGVIGIGATLVGVMLGGALVAKMGINRSAWVAAALQIMSNLFYYWIAVAGPEDFLLVVAVVGENIAGGVVTAVFVALLMSLCSKRFSATQFALFSSLFAAARDIIVAPAGAIAESTGWPMYFLFTLAVGLPVLLLLPLITPWNGEAPRGAATHSGQVVEDDGHVEGPAV